MPQVSRQISPRGLLFVKWTSTFNRLVNGQIGSFVNHAIRSRIAVSAALTAICS